MVGGGGYLVLALDFRLWGKSSQKSDTFSPPPVIIDIDVCSSATEWVYTYSSISSGGTPSRRGRLCTPKRCLCLCCTLCCCFAVAYLVALLALSYDGYTDCLPPISDGADGWESLTPVMLRTVGGSCYGAVNATILPLNAVQTVGWHNSYHLAPNFTLPGFNLLVRAFDYERTSLSDQLSAGYRNFELDLHIRRGQVHVFHIQVGRCLSAFGRLGWGWGK